MAAKFSAVMFSVLALTFAAATPQTATAEPALSGTWICDEYGDIITFDNGDWELWIDGYPEAQGTYTAADGIIAMSETHFHAADLFGFGVTRLSDDRLYSLSEVLLIFADVFLEELAEEAGSEFTLMLNYMLADTDAFFAEVEEGIADMNELFGEIGETFYAELALITEKFSGLLPAWLETDPPPGEIDGEIFAVFASALSQIFALMILVEAYGIVEGLLSTYEGTYSVTGDTLLLDFGGEARAFSRLYR